MSRVMVAAMGVATPRAADLDEFTAVLEARSHAQVAAPHDRSADRVSELAILALDQVLQAARLPASVLSRTAIVVGLGLSENAVDGVPTIIPLRDRLATLAGVGGVRVATYTACATGTDAVGLGLGLIRAGEADDVLVVAADSPLGTMTRGAFSRLGVLAVDRPGLPAACRAFAADRNGFVLAEGAACVLLRKTHADDRDAVFVDGYGSSVDAFGPTSPDPEGWALVDAIRRALVVAGIDAKDVDVVNAHGTGTVHNDASEARALLAVLGNRASAVPVVASKSILGHSVAAAGLIEMIAAVVGLRRAFLHGNPWLSRRDPTLRLDPVGPEMRPYPHRIVLKCSTAFGGHNAAIILRRG